MDDTWIKGVWGPLGVVAVNKGAKKKVGTGRYMGVGPSGGWFGVGL